VCIPGWCIGGVPTRVVYRGVYLPGCTIGYTPLIPGCTIGYTPLIPRVYNGGIPRGVPKVYNGGIPRGVPKGVYTSQVGILGWVYTSQVGIPVVYMPVSPR